MLRPLGSELVIMITWTRCVCSLPRLRHWQWDRFWRDVCVCSCMCSIGFVVMYCVWFRLLRTGPEDCVKKRVGVWWWEWSEVLEGSYPQRVDSIWRVLMLVSTISFFEKGCLFFPGCLLYKGPWDRSQDDDETGRRRQIVNPCVNMRDGGFKRFDIGVSVSEPKGNGDWVCLKRPSDCLILWKPSSARHYTPLEYPSLYWGSL